MIIKHELVHIRQKHSADIIFIEILKIVNWFNPFIYLLQYSLREIHEYIADEQTAATETDTLTYSSFLVNNAYGLGGSSITHSFFNYNLLKKRIIMLHQKRSGSLARLKYLLAIPICGALLCASTLAFSKTYGWVDIAPHATHRINPANKSAQVPEPIRRLLLTRNGISTITDQFTATRTNGTTRIYTVRNLTNKDIVDLKTKGITVNIISDVNADSSKLKVPPPPPHAPPVKRVEFPLPDPMTQRTAKGYYYSESVYTDNGKQDIVVTFKEKDGSHKEFTKSKATPAELTLLKDKYGYVFPAHVNAPPPPPVPKASFDKRPPPPPPAPPVAKVSRKLPPPPPPFEDVYKDFFSYLQKTTTYPKQASANGLAGVVIAQYILDNNGHITSVEIVKSDIDAFNAEVMRAVKSYTGNINNASGEYCVVFRFCIAGETDNNAVRDEDAKLLQTTPKYTGEITIVGKR